MAAEIEEQPGVWRDILQRQEEIKALARYISERMPKYVILAGRGTSGHAALYGKYLVEVLLHLPAGLASPSVLTLYNSELSLPGVLMLAISQSGQSPDMVRSVQAARRGGALTLAITNAPHSSLAAASELHFDVAAGPERSVAATKSYSAQLLSLFLILDRLRGGDGSETESLPELGAATLKRAGEQCPALAAHYQFAQRLILTGRGYSYATAREAALKLMETSYLSAQAFSGAELLHGPIAILDKTIPVLAVAPPGPARSAMTPVLDRIRQTGADLFLVGNLTGAPTGTRGFNLPDVTDALSPLIEILPFQKLALDLARLRGENPDIPRGLNKITETL